MCHRDQRQTTRWLLGTPVYLCQGYGMVLVIIWVLAVMALLALVIAWGATIDDASRTYTRSARPMRGVHGRMASSASR
jgi:hypothetical protein